MTRIDSDCSYSQESGGKDDDDDEESELDEDDVLAPVVSFLWEPFCLFVWHPS